MDQLRFQLELPLLPSERVVGIQLLLTFSYELHVSVLRWKRGVSPAALSIGRQLACIVSLVVNTVAFPWFLFEAEQHFCPIR